MILAAGRMETNRIAEGINQGWIFVLNPPLDRPIAWPMPTFWGNGTVLMGAHDGAVDHCLFIVRLCGQPLKNALPDPGFSPTADATVNVLPALRQVRTVPIEHRLHEQAGI